MTMEELERARSIRGEIRMLKERINTLDETLLPGISTDGTHSQNPSSPVEAHLRKKMKLEEDLRRYLRELEREIGRIDDWLREVEDPQIRCIVTGRYIIGYSWRRVSRECCGRSAGESVARKRLKRYLER